MSQKKIIDQLNIVKQCKGYGVPLLKCPQFLFLVMGIFIIVVILATFFLGDNFFEDPLLILFVVTIEAIVLFVMGFPIISGFEKMAQANQMKSDFIDLVTHQLRSPLTTLKWGFEDLKEDLEMSEEDKDYIDSLERNVEKMTEMVNNLLLISKMDQDGYRPDKESFSLNEVLEKVLKDYIIKEDSKVKLVKKIKETPKINSDPHQLEIVIDNFISNAIKYTPKGGKMTVELREDGHFIFFQVTDSGIGIPKEDYPKVFAKFERASNTAKVQETGSGLGLFLTKEIVRKLRGKIGFKSVENKGSSFWFKIPKK